VKEGIGSFVSASAVFGSASPIHLGNPG